MKCEKCGKHNAIYECEECDILVCGYCARATDYECLDCILEPPMFYPLKIKGKQK